MHACIDALVGRSYGTTDIEMQSTALFFNYSSNWILERLNNSTMPKGIKLESTTSNAPNFSINCSPYSATSHRSCTLRSTHRFDQCLLDRKAASIAGVLLTSSCSRSVIAALN